MDSEEEWIKTLDNGLKEIGAVTSHQIISDRDRLWYTINQIKELSEQLNVIDKRNKQLGEKILEAGCVIEDPMSLDFQVTNPRADKIEYKLSQIVSLLRLYDSEELLNALAEILKEE